MSADEFDTIRRLFAPLATNPAARGLVDDVAVLEASGSLVVTTDAIVEGVHFLPDDPIETVAKKALRVNLSDLTAKGARCVGVLLTLVWPDQRPSAQLTTFADGLAEDLTFFDVPLLGGDTARTPGPLVVSMTALGEALEARIPSRADAIPGDHLWVTGFIGEAYLGLRALTELPPVLGASPDDQVDLAAIQVRSSYRTPYPPVPLAECIARYARASTDVSDGLVADAANIANASGVAIRLDAEAIPLGLAGHNYVAKHGAKGLVELITGGDDYQALFTADSAHRREILAISRAAGVNAVVIGHVTEGRGVKVIDANGAEIATYALGHRHTLGR
ncbi:MAG: thiamine-phosphate kinase [Proteobacteria bacterium]|nr:thiamine-phosphate kinase [Pseudomonadota bacterium]